MAHFHSKVGATIVTSVAAAGVFLAGPPIAEASSFGSQNLSFAMQSNDVVVLQETLKEKGFFHYHTATGYFGEITRKAVRDFQRDHQLVTDGIVGPKTFSALNNKSLQSQQPVKVVVKGAKSHHSSSISTTVPSFQVNSIEQLSTKGTLVNGSRGQEVEKLQSFLKRAGFYEYHSVTGYFGDVTQRAVGQYQQARHLQVDGMAGPQTLAAINKEIKLTNPSVSNPNGIAPTNTPVEKESSQPESNDNSNSGNHSQASTLLQDGSQGDAVMELQNRLQVLGYLSQEPTGYFGSVTKTAVIDFQKAWHLLADGLVTQSTWDKLEEVSSVHMENVDHSSTVKEFNVLNIVADAADYLGIPYVWGGTSSEGFDCSGFVQYIFKNNGVHLPRTVADQWDATEEVSTPKVGDIVYFETYKGGPSHNGIYIGNNQFIHSGTSTGVVVATIEDNSYWSPRYLGARTVK